MLSTDLPRSRGNGLPHPCIRYKAVFGVGSFVAQINWSIGNQTYTIARDRQHLPAAHLVHEGLAPSEQGAAPLYAPESG